MAIEGSPSVDREESGSNKANRAEALGIFAMEPKSEIETKSNNEKRADLLELIKNSIEQTGDFLNPKSNPENNSFEKVSAPAVDKAELLPIEKHIETLSRKDLLELSGKIVVEGSSLNQIYETHLISENALRRIVAEHLSGGDLRLALRRELVQHEIDFERDPQLRDKSRQRSQAQSAQLSQMIEKLESDIQAEVAQDNAVMEAREVHEKKVVSRQKRRRQLLDFVMLSVIVILLASIIALVMSRH